MIEFLKLVIPGTIGTFAFSLIFSVKRKNLIFTALGGLLVCVIYYFSQSLGDFVSNSICAFFATMYCEVCAKFRKAPVVAFLPPVIISLVPGSKLYYTAASFIKRNYNEAGKLAVSTLKICLGLAAGFLIAVLIISIIKNYKREKGNK